jgi:hypothetical protein
MTTFQKMLALHMIDATPPSHHYVAAPWGALVMVATIAFVIGFILGEYI